MVKGLFLHCLQVLRMMVGVNISDEQLGSIADRTIQEADTNGDNSISFNEFIKVSFVFSWQLFFFTAHLEFLHFNYEG